MTAWGTAILLITFALSVLSAGFALVIVAHNRKTAKTVRPCYRCAAVATGEFAGLPYCLMCKITVSQMWAAVQHDPPYGFPGSTGYLEFPALEKKKEEEQTHG